MKEASLTPTMARSSPPGRSTRNVAKYGHRMNRDSVGDCHFNAMIESFWARMQTELLKRGKWATTVELSDEMGDYVDNFHNRRRHHSTLDMPSPAEYEHPPEPSTA